MSSAPPIPRPQLEAALQHARAHPRWKNYVDQDLPKKPLPGTGAAETGGFLVGANIGGFGAWYLLQNQIVLRTPHYLHEGWDFKPEGWAIRPKLRVNPTVFVVGCGMIAGFIGRSIFAGMRERRLREWQRIGIVPKQH